MTVSETARRGTGFVIAADGSYAARLVTSPHARQEAAAPDRAGGPPGPGANAPVADGAAESGTAPGAGGRGTARYAERWTLGGPEPYAVVLPTARPEEPGAEVLPMPDGRVLIHRSSEATHFFSLLYPTGPGTGELPLGAVECLRADGTPGRLSLLPPPPVAQRAYALAPGLHSTSVWLVAGGAFGPEHLAEIPGHCTGGVWLDRAGRMLAVDRAGEDGVVKAVAVDLERGGEVSPLLQIAQASNDRLLLADIDSGLLLIRSDAPGQDRLAWGVLGSSLPVRFPECLAGGNRALTPFAIQPGQDLLPEHSAVAFRVDGVTGGSWVGVWRPAGRRLHELPAPRRWLTGSGLWTREGVLRLPQVTEDGSCGLARVTWPAGSETGEVALGGAAHENAAHEETATARSPEHRAQRRGGREQEGAEEASAGPAEPASAPAPSLPEASPPAGTHPHTHERTSDVPDSATRPLPRVDPQAPRARAAEAEADGTGTGTGGTGTAGAVAVQEAQAPPPTEARRPPQHPTPPAPPPSAAPPPAAPLPTRHQQGHRAPSPAWDSEVQLPEQPTSFALSVTAVSGFAGVAGPSTLASGVRFAGAAMRTGLITTGRAARENAAPPDSRSTTGGHPAQEHPSGITWTTAPPSGPSGADDGGPVPAQEAPLTR